MALAFSSATGNLFNRLGALAELLRTLRVYQNDLNTDMTAASGGVTSELVSEPDLQALMGSNYLSALDSATNVGQIAQGIAERVVDRMVFRDSPRAGQTLTSPQLFASLQEVIRQMKAQSATIQVQTVVGTVSTVAGQPGPHFTGDGNGVVAISTRRWDGLQQENLYAETLLVSCIQDSYTGNATAGRESFAVSGAGAQSNRYAFNWPLGSGASTNLQAIASTSDNADGNLLTNSDFAAFTSDAPDNFNVVTGTAGTDFDDETGLVFTSGGKALKLIGTSGQVNVNLTQQFGISTGTLGEVEAATQYSWNAWFRRDGTAAAAGVLTVDLIDSGGAVVQDDNGNSNSFTVDLTALTITYTNYGGAFRLPSNPPSTILLRLRLTTALTDGRSVYMANMSLGEMTQVYTGGPSIAVHSGGSNFVLGDQASAAFTNDRGGATNLASFGPTLQRFFNLAALDLLFSSASSPSVQDSLIQ